MKKIVSVHLNSIIFQIEDDAYKYLNNVISGQREKKRLEEEVAEILSGKLSLTKSVITFPDVVECLYELGFSASDMEAMQGQKNPLVKKLYRQPKDKMIAGVCSGLGEYFDIDPMIVRILFIIGLFLGTFGLWVYLAMWLIVPNAPKKLES